MAWIPKETQCKRCKTTFLPIAGNQKFCSVSCREEHASAKAIGTKWIIFNRDGCRCAYCGSTPLDDGIKLVPDHIVPYSKGGLHTAGNLITSCQRCNNSKHAKHLSPESLNYLLSYVEKANKREGIPSDKIIEGSHTRNEHVSAH